MVTLTINKRTVTVPEGTTILEAARMAGITIPTLCYLKDVNEIGACRICCVEVEGVDRLVAACDNPAEEGMVVHTNSPLARQARETNLRLILSQHRVSCPTCTRNGNCTLQKLCADHNLLGELYEKQIRDSVPDLSAPFIRLRTTAATCSRCCAVPMTAWSRAFSAVRSWSGS